MQPRSLSAKQTIRLFFFFFLPPLTTASWVKSTEYTDGRCPSSYLNDPPCPNVLLSSNFPPRAARAGCQDSDRLYLIRAGKEVSITLPPLLTCPLEQHILMVTEGLETILPGACCWDAGGQNCPFPPQPGNFGQHGTASAPNLPAGPPKARRQEWFPSTTWHYEGQGKGLGRNWSNAGSGGSAPALPLSRRCCRLAERAGRAISEVLSSPSSSPLPPPELSLMHQHEMTLSEALVCDGGETTPQNLHPQESLSTIF